MKLLDKIKNTLFEEEETFEIDEPIRKPVRKEKKQVEKESPIAKKVKVKETEEPFNLDEELEQDFDESYIDIQDSFEKVKEVEPQTQQPLYIKDDTFDIPVVNSRKNRVDKYEDNSFEEPKLIKLEESYKKPEPKSNIYQEEKQPYGMKEEVVIKGAYEKKEEKKSFKPSPVISPIHGILDKDYKREDIIPKREVRITSRFEKEKLSLEDVRQKAFGKEEISTTYSDNSLVEDTPFKIEREESVVDLNSQDAVEVKEVTVGDAMEYFEDLGLEYNVDYKDATKTKSRVKEDVEYKKVEEVKPDETKEEKSNLFDLLESVDSMYDKE